MNVEEYLKNRVDNQIEWFNKKSGAYKRYYNILRMLELVIAGLIPFLTGYVDLYILIKPTIGLMGVLVGLIAGILSLFKFQENWIQYRSACESLQSEKYLFQTNAAPYDTDQAFHIFVQKVESMLTGENRAWSQYTKSAGESGSKG